VRRTTRQQRPRTKEARKLLREIERAGHEVVITSNGHMQVRGPLGIALLCVAFDGPNSRRGALADLKRAGIELPA
jgi:hypothetical protein